MCNTGGRNVAVVDASIPSSCRYQSSCRESAAWLIAKSKSARCRYAGQVLEVSSAELFFLGRKRQHVHRCYAAPLSVGVLNRHRGQMLRLVDRWHQFQAIGQSGGDGGGEGRPGTVRFLTG